MVISKSKVSYVNAFLKNFKKPVQVCYSVGTHAASGMIPASLNVALGKNGIENYNQKDCYFYVNSGGTKQEEIKYLNACFVDIDAGRDSNKKYFKKSVVDAKKRKMLTFINSFPYKPNLLVETRNGFQLYWLTNGVPANSTNKQLWNQVQNRINNAFRSIGSDYKVRKINQIMRLPGTIWYKKYEGKKETFNTTFKKLSNTKYTLTYLNNYFKNQPSHLKFDTKRTLSKVWASPQTAVKSLDRSNISKYTNTYQKPQTQLTDIKDYDDKQNLKDFMRDIAQILYAKKMNFLSKQAWSFYNSL